MNIFSKIYYLIYDYDLLDSDLIPVLVVLVMCLFVGGLLIWGVIAAGNSIRGAINRDTELQREKKQKEIELIQAQIDYYNNQREKGT